MIQPYQEHFVSLKHDSCEKSISHRRMFPFLSQISQMTQIVSLTKALKTGYAYLRDPRNLREIINS